MLAHCSNIQSGDNHSSLARQDASVYTSQCLVNYEAFQFTQWEQALCNHQALSAIISVVISLLLLILLTQVAFSYTCSDPYLFEYTKGILSDPQNSISVQPSLLQCSAYKLTALASFDSSSVSSTQKDQDVIIRLHFPAMIPEHSSGSNWGLL